MEIWKTIPSYPDYEISSFGNIRRLTAAERTFIGRKIKPYRGKWGHLFAHLGRGNGVSIHRLVLETFSGPCPDGMEARHLNGNPADNRPENLAWGTKKENAMDKKKHGTFYQKLSDEIIELIRLKYQAGDTTQTELAKEFGVSQVRISQITKSLR